MATVNDQASGRIVHEIRWSEALPWWILFRAAGATFSPTVILLAAFGALAAWAGGSLADRLQLAGSDPATDAIVESELQGLGGPIMPGPAGDIPGQPTGLSPSARVFPVLPAVQERLPAPLSEVLRLVALPVQPTATMRQVGGALARIGWFVLVWSIFGTAIVRHVALKLVEEDPPGLIGALWFGTTKWLAAFNAAAFVLIGMLALCVPGAILGLCMRTDLGLAVAGAIWPLVLAGAVVLAILAIGVVAGWPLMVAAVGVERGDSFQAISTSFSYLYQRPLHCAFYAVVAAIVAMPAFAAAALLADATSTLAMWAASFGMGHARTVAVMEAMRTASEAIAPAQPWGAQALAFWNRGLGWLLGSFGWGYFWAIATAAYLLLRQAVDGTELDEVVLDEPGAG
jgi:hypothetical protein